MVRSLKGAGGGGGIRIRMREDYQTILLRGKDWGGDLETRFTPQRGEEIKTGKKMVKKEWG